MLEKMQSGNLTPAEMEKFGIPMSLDGQSPMMPPELIGKTVHQIKQMGGTELG